MNGENMKLTGYLPFRPVGLPVFLTFMVGLLLVSGCVSLKSPPSFVNLAHHDLQRTMEKTRPHLVHVTLKKVTAEQIRRVGGMVFKTPGSTRIQKYTGIAVREGNYVLVPLKLDKEDMQHLSAWIGEDECKVKFIDYDKQLNLSIVQIQTAIELSPMALPTRPEPAPGLWMASLSPAGEDDYFTPQTALYMICGRRPTRYPELVVDGIGNANPGAPLLDRAGYPVGIITSSNTAIALSPAFCFELSAFIDSSLSGKSEDEEEKKGRLGICLQPIDNDLAKYLDVPKSALWVAHILPGSAGEKAGLKTGDLIVAFDGEALRFSGNRTRDDFNWRVEDRKFKPFSLTVWRDGKTSTHKCRRKPYSPPVEFQTKELGLVVREIDENAYAHRNLTVHDGVLVTRVIAGSPASTSSTFGRSLIRKNDVIVEVNGIPCPDISSFREAVEAVRLNGSHAVLVKYRRGRLYGYAGLNLAIGSTSNGDAQ